MLADTRAHTHAHTHAHACSSAGLLEPVTCLAACATWPDAAAQLSPANLSINLLRRRAAAAACLSTHERTQVPNKRLLQPSRSRQSWPVAPLAQTPDSSGDRQARLLRSHPITARGNFLAPNSAESTMRTRLPAISSLSAPCSHTGGGK